MFTPPVGPPTLHREGYCVHCGWYMGRLVEGSEFDCKNPNCDLYRVMQLGLSEPNVTNQGPSSEAEPDQPTKNRVPVLPPPQVTKIETFTKTS